MADAVLVGTLRLEVVRQPVHPVPFGLAVRVPAARSRPTVAIERCPVALFLAGAKRTTVGELTVAVPSARGTIRQLGDVADLLFLLSAVVVFDANFARFDA